MGGGAHPFPFFASIVCKRQGRPFELREKLSFEMTAARFHLYFKRINFAPSTAGNDDAQVRVKFSLWKTAHQDPVGWHAAGGLHHGAQNSDSKERAREGCARASANPPPSSEAGPALRPRARAPAGPAVLLRSLHTPSPPNPDPPRPREPRGAVRTRGGAFSPNNSHGD